MTDEIRPIGRFNYDPLEERVELPDGIVTEKGNLYILDRRGRIYLGAKVEDDSIDLSNSVGLIERTEDEKDKFEEAMLAEIASVERLDKAITLGKYALWVAAIGVTVDLLYSYFSN
jgi:hypothetical protein